MHSIFAFQIDHYLTQPIGLKIHLANATKKRVYKTNT